MPVGDGGDGCTRRGRHPDASTRVTPRLKRPHGPCPRCGLHDRAGDELDVDPTFLPTAEDGPEGDDTWPLLPGHVTMNRGGRPWQVCLTRTSRVRTV